MRDLISDNFEVCITQRKLQCWKWHHDSTGKTLHTDCNPSTFLLDLAEGQVWSANEIHRPERKSESPKFQKYILQTATPGLQCHQEGEKIKDVAASASRHLQSSPASPEQLRGHSEQAAMHKDLQGTGLSRDSKALAPSSVCSEVVPEPHPVTAAGTVCQQHWEFSVLLSQGVLDAALLHRSGRIIENATIYLEILQQTWLGEKVWTWSMCRALYIAQVHSCLMQNRKIISSALMFSAFSAQRHRKYAGDSNVLLMTYSLSQRSQPSLLFPCTAWLQPVQLHGSAPASGRHRETQASSQSDALQLSQTNGQLQTSKHKALETLESKLPSFGLLHVLNAMIWSLTVTAVTVWKIY